MLEWSLRMDERRGYRNTAYSFAILLDSEVVETSRPSVIDIFVVVVVVSETLKIADDGVFKKSWRQEARTREGAPELPLSLFQKLDTQLLPFVKRYADNLLLVRSRFRRALRPISICSALPEQDPLENPSQAPPPCDDYSRADASERGQHCRLP